MKLTIEQVIERSRQVHGDKYDYSESVYTSSREKMKIICRKHGEFFQSPNAHFSGSGCPNCARGRYAKKMITTEEFIKEAMFIPKVREGKYDFSKTVYVSSSEKVVISCPKHGDFSIRPNHLLSAHVGCPTCFNERRGEARTIPLETMIARAVAIHGDKYSYAYITDYVNTVAKVPIYCKEHKEIFHMSMGRHVNGKRMCPRCTKDKRLYDL